METSEKKKLIYRKDLPGPRGLPLVGKGFDVKLDNLHNDIAVWAREYGGVFKLKLGTSNLTVVSDPEIIHEILKRRPDDFIRMAKLNNVIREQGIHGLFNAEGEDWKLHRKIVAKGLDVKHQEQFFPYMLTCIERLYNKWERAAENNEELDIQKDFLRFTVDVTTYLAFAYEMNTIEEKGGVIQDHLEKIFPMIFKRINEPIPFYKFIKSKKDKEFDQALTEIDKLLDVFIKNGKQRILDNPELKENPSTVLEAILTASETEDMFGDDEVKGNLMTLLMAGEDTTAHTLAWSIFQLTQEENKSSVVKMQDEIDSALGNDKWMKDYSWRNKLNYVENVANETMRIDPVAPLLLNEPLKDVVVGDYFFEKGCKLLILTRVAALSEDNFTNSQEFNPDRWSAESKCPMHNVKASIPFGSGARYCPGRNLAILEMKLVLSMLFKNFDVEMVTKHSEVKEIMAFTMMASDYRVKLKKRD